MTMPGLRPLRPIVPAVRSRVTSRATSLGVAVSHERVFDGAADQAIDLQSLCPTQSLCHTTHVWESKTREPCRLGTYRHDPTTPTGCSSSHRMASSIN